MANRGRFYLGRPGRVRALNSLTRQSNPQATEVLVGASTRSLSGRTTRDTFAVKKEWQFTWERLFEPDYQRLRGLSLSNPAVASLRLVDLRNRNQFTRAVSLGGSDTLSADAFEVVNTGVNSPGTMAYQLNTAWGTFNTAMDDAIDGQIAWSHTAKAGLPILRTRDSAVVWPSSVYRYSFYLAGSGSTFTPYVRNLDRTGAEISTSLGTATVPTAGGVRYEYVYTPPVGTAEAQFGLTYSGTGVSLFLVTAFYLGVDEPSMLSWVPGAGQPQVLTSLAVTYPWPDQYHCVMNLVEV